ncbi:MAG TPA: aromatic amino acid transport family protein [Chlamydiales bacterium]|jgi:tyrosine-specific transport protein|nr:aromatic amino acid transport family protein [Chlamydiales bacterium]
MRLIHSLGHVVGGTLLVAGTTIGVGMLALPVATGSLGFVPSFALYILCWLFMLCTGMLLVEVNLWMPKDKSFISMAEKVLGSVGKNIFWIAYLFLFITVMIAHVAGGGEILKSIPGWPFPLWLSGIIYTLVFAPVVYLGTRSVDRLNLFLISGVVFFYLGFIAVSISSVRFDLLKTAEWRNAWFALPILFTAFTYQVIIPTLMSYMEQNVRKVRIAIFFGSSIPLLIYLLWEFVILGIVPKEGPLGLIETASLGQNAVTPLKYFVQSRWILTFSHWFAFFALTTSFIPLALSFFDFLADGLNWEKKGMRRFSLTAIVFGVPTVIAILYPNIFLVALGYAGGISCAFLFGLMPPLMVWIGRYVKHYPAETRQLFGGKPFLVILMVFAFLILAGEIFQQIF